MASRNILSLTTKSRMLSKAVSDAPHPTPNLHRSRSVQNTSTKLISVILPKQSRAPTAFHDTEAKRTTWNRLRIVSSTMRYLFLYPYSAHPLRSAGLRGASALNHIPLTDPRRHGPAVTRKHRVLARRLLQITCHRRRDLRPRAILATRITPYCNTVTPTPMA